MQELNVAWSEQLQPSRRWHLRAYRFNLPLWTSFDHVSVSRLDRVHRRGQGICGDQQICDHQPHRRHSGSCEIQQLASNGFLLLYLAIAKIKHAASAAMISGTKAQLQTG